MEKPKRIEEILDIISEMIIKYIEDCRKGGDDSEPEELLAV
jgi:hypothetical protein